MTKYQVALVSTSLLGDSFIFQFDIRKKHIFNTFTYVIVYYLKYVNTHNVIIQ
jgi:hypothetical protein